MSGGKCMLTIYYSFSENVILQARLPELDLDRKNFSLTLDKIKKEQVSTFLRHSVYTLAQMIIEQ